MYEDGVQDTRIPDVSFIRKGRLPKGEDKKRPFRGSPDLAVEVVSPSESAAILRSKVLDYLSEGTEQVWIVYPDQKEVHVHEGSESEDVRIYRGQDRLRAETLFPDLKIPIAEFFVEDNFED